MAVRKAALAIAPVNNIFISYIYIFKVAASLTMQITSPGGNSGQGGAVKLASVYN